MSNLGYFSRKLLVAVLTIVGAVACMFLLLEFVPGNLVDAVLGTNATPELRAAFAEKLGLDQPFYVRMLRFLQGALHGDFGADIISGQTISSMILNVLPFTLALAFSALAMGLLLGIPLGCLAATRPGSFADRALGLISITFISVPNFVVSISLLLIFSMTLHLLPVAGAGEPGDIVDQLLHLILPTIALSLGWVGYVARILRASLLEVLAEPHIRTMRAYGVSESRVIWRYAASPCAIGSHTWAWFWRSDFGGNLCRDHFCAPRSGQFDCTCGFRKKLSNRSGRILGCGCVLYRVEHKCRHACGHAGP
jgi:peptide/nickel transport system permease protein